MTTTKEGGMEGAEAAPGGGGDGTTKKVQQLDHLRHRLERFHRQLLGYMQDFEDIMVKRQTQQEKRDRFLGLVKAIVMEQQGVSMSMVELYQEREMSLERSRRLQQLKTIEIQNQRRIQELLIKTDPSRTKEEIKAASASLEKDARRDVVMLTVRSLEEQRRGYRDLALSYVTGLQEDSKQRDDEIKWCRDFCHGTLTDFEALVKKAEGRHAKLIDRYLVRRHNSRLLKEGLDYMRQECSKARQQVEEEGRALREKQALEIRALKRASEREVELRMESLRGRVRAREDDLRDLREWYTRIQQQYDVRVSELARDVKAEKAKTKRLRKVRAVGHDTFTTAIRDVRDRLNQFQRDRYMHKAKFDDMRELLEELYQMEQQQQYSSSSSSSSSSHSHHPTHHPNHSHHTGDLSPVAEEEEHEEVN